MQSGGHRVKRAGELCQKIDHFGCSWASRSDSVPQRASAVSAWASSSGNAALVTESEPPESDECVRVAGIDYGMARIGVAVADELGILAHPRPFVAARPPARALGELGRLARAESLSLFVLGLPRNMDGSEGQSARRVRKFAESLRVATGIRVEFVDERLSTVQAQARLHEAGRNERSSKTRIDSASAAILLQTWLDGRRNRVGE